jgi:3-oxoacyl-[acyl-carrier protein] reductase
MDLGIAGRHALVMGAGGGLGGAIARALAAEGARVAVADLDESAAEHTAGAIRDAGGHAAAFAWDLRDVDAFEERLEAARAFGGDVDILVNNTGGPPPTPVAGVAPEDWRRHFDAMVLSVMRLTDLVLPSMRSRRWGRVITSASSGVVAPIPNLGISNALRLVLVGWSKTLAGEVGADGVTSNIVVPGRIATPRIVSLDEARASRESTTVDEVVAKSTSTIPLRRYGDPAEYAAAFAFLAGTRASYITGSVLRVDGGLIASV